MASSMYMRRTIERDLIERQSSNAKIAINRARFAEREITFESPWRLLEQNIKIAAINLAHDRLE